MKTALALIVIILSFELNAQSFDEFRRKIQLIKNPEAIDRDTTGFSRLPNFILGCNDDFDAYDVQENKKKWDYYHVIDLNGDGLNDFIYSGPCSPYDQTSVFMNNGSRLNNVFEHAGKIIAIRRLSDRTILTVFKESCCCDYNSDLIDVIVDHDGKVDERWITFFGGTEIQVERIERLSLRGILRTHPELIDSVRKESCTDVMVKGNHLKNILSTTEVIQLRRDGSWRLVLYPEDKKHSWIGWIKSD